MEKLLNALRETLASLGLDETAIEAALQEAVAKAEGSEEDPQPSGDPAPTPSEGDVPQTEPEVPGDEGDGDPVEGNPNPEEVPTTEGDPVPPTEPVPPAEPTPAVPPFDPAPLIAQITELRGKLDESLKANQGLAARVQALEESLKTAGVIEGQPVVNEVGDQLPNAAPQSPTDDVLEDVLAELNGKK